MSEIEHNINDIMGDPFYGSMLRNGASIKDVIDAGWFDTKYPMNASFENDKKKLYNFPTGKAFLNYKKSTNKKAVIFSTGAFCPLHLGHTQMMDEARLRLIDQGYDVIAGYLVPGHMDYIVEKYSNKPNYDNSLYIGKHRSHIIDMVCSKSDWLENYPTDQNTPCELNFTYFYRIFKEFFEDMNMPVDIFYVFGSDNHGFVNCQIPTIEIERTEISATGVREGTCSDIHDTTKKFFDMIPENDDRPYVIRDEGFEFYNGILEFDEYENKKKILKDAISKILHREVLVVSAVYQISEMKKKLKGKKAISLDPLFSGDNVYQLGISRLYDAHNAQIAPLAMIPRIEIGKSLEEQIALLPEGEYVLVEDDIATGKTIKTILEMLPQNIKITGIELLTQFSGYDSNDIFDVIDLRDFIDGAPYGGLVVFDKGTISRKSYLRQEVNLASRAKIDGALLKTLIDTF